MAHTTTTLYLSPWREGRVCFELIQNPSFFALKPFVKMAFMFSQYTFSQSPLVSVLQVRLIQPLLGVLVLAALGAVGIQR